MKKWLIAAILTAVCCVSGCGSKGGNSEDSTPDVGEMMGYTKIVTPYMVGDFAVLSFTDTEKSLTIDMTGNRYLKGLLADVNYYLPKDEVSVDTAEAKYVISMQGVDVNVGFDGENSNVCFSFADGSTQWSVVLQDEFSYLDTVIASEIVSIDGYTPAHNIRVHNADNVGGAVKDKAAFLESLQGLRFVKLNNLSHYDLGEKTHTVKLGDDEMSIYSKYVVYKGELYFTYQGDFAFLKNVELESSSGWLPWL